MKLTDRPLGKTKLVGGRLFLDFINTVGGRSDVEIIERLDEFEDLLAWSGRTEILTEAETRNLLKRVPKSEAEAVLRRAIDLREALYRLSLAIIAGNNPASADVDSLNREAVIARRHQELTSTADGIFWTWIKEKNAPDKMLWTVADSAAEFFTDGDLTRLRKCGGDNCAWLFEDTTRNRSRTWCDMKDCGNLAKVRRFRQKEAV